MKSRGLAILAAAVAFCVTDSFGSIFACRAGDSTVLVEEDGRLALNILGASQNTWIYVCSLSSGTPAPGAALANMPVETCKAWYNAVLAAKALNKPIYLTFETNNTRAGSTGATNCDAIVAGQGWTYPNPMPYFLQVNF